MAERFQRHPSPYEGGQAGCIWGLISIFDFRHGRSTRKLLADRRRAGAGRSSTETVLPNLAEICENVVDTEEHKMLIADVAKTSVKELMDEEMFNEQVLENQSNCSDMDLEKIGSNLENNHRRGNRTCHKSRDMDVSELDAAKFSPPSDNLDLEMLMQELAQINQESTDHGGQTLKVLEEKLAAAVDLFIEQRLSKSKHFGEGGKSCWSKEFMDAHQTLSLKDLFLKLLEDRDSQLVKHIQNLEGGRLGSRTCSSSPANNLSEEDPKGLKCDKFNSRRHRNFFRRRSKSLCSYPFEGDEDCRSSSKIVILKPVTAGGQNPRVHNERNVSQFSLTEIRKKLRQAIGKRKQGNYPDKFSSTHQNGNGADKCTAVENFAWSSSNRNHFCTERFAKSSTSLKRDERVGKLNDSVSAKPGAPNIYFEAEKHLSEMLNKGDENAETMTRQLPRSLGRILSLPEYSDSPCCSPRKQSDGIFTTSPMRLSADGSVKENVDGLLQENHSNCPSPSRQTMECQPCISGSSPNDEVRDPFKGDKECSSEIQSFTEDTVIPEVVEVQETTGFMPLWEEEKTTIICSESSSRLITGDTQNGDTTEVDSSLCFKSDLIGKVQILSSPPVSPSHKEVEDSDCAIDKMERPSPVSVLEPLFTEDDISPASTISRPVEIQIQTRHIHFEEQASASNQGICTRISLDDEESAFEYVEAVLLGSGLNWDEFLLRWISSYEILDSSLFDEVELFSGRPRYDQKLLFDCTNEVLKEVCGSLFGTFPVNTRPVLKGMDLINKVWEQVERHLFQHPSLHSLDQLVKIDLARSGKWTNLQSDIELISFEMGETIFDELLQDTLLSLVDGTSDAIEDTDL